MALENTPWFVGNGAEHSAAMSRMIAFAATGGKSGIADRADLKVKAQSVPNGSVRVAPGVATLVNTYAGGSGQAYVARNLSQTTVNIEPTGSASGRSDLIVLEIVDPEFEGDAPADPNNFQYTRLTVIPGVTSTRVTLNGLNYPRPAIPLARIDLPKSTGTVTAAMITSVRELANPRKERVLFTHGITAEDPSDTLNYATASQEGGEAFPNIFWTVDIPEWAQRVKIIGTWAQLKVPGSGGNNYGKLWVRIGTMPNGFSSQQVNWDIDSTKTGVTRETMICAADRSVPAEFRGTTRQAYLRGSVINNNKNTLAIDSASAISLDLEFYEIPV